MRYMLLVYLDEQALSGTERAECYEESTKLTHQLAASGNFLDAAPLHPTSTATSVRIREGRRLVTDGPFAETREQLGGFFMVNAANLDEAIGIGRDAGLPVVIYHLKVAAKANWGRMSEAVAKIDEARTQGVNVSATMYPYTAGGTGLAATLPLWVQEGGREKMLERLKDPASRARARSLYSPASTRTVTPSFLSSRRGSQECGVKPKRTAPDARSSGRSPVGRWAASRRSSSSTRLAAH